MEEQVLTATAEKAPPHDERAEQSTLGALLIDPEAISQISPFLRPDDFYRKRHALVYAAIIDLFDRREPSDFITVSNELERRGQLDLVGGVSYLTGLINAAPTSVHVEHYGHIVERTSIMRRLIEAAGKIAAIGFEASPEVDQALDRAEQELFAVSQRRVTQDFVSLREILGPLFDEIDYLHQHKGEIMGVQTGFTDLDKMTGGLKASDLVIIAGRPGVGKTAFCLSMARNMAVKNNVPVAIFSLEMSAEQLAHRLLSSEASVDSQRLRSGFIDEFEWRRISEAFGTLADSPVYIDDVGTLTSVELRMKSRRLRVEHGIQLIIVDYLQLMHGSGKENRVQEVSEISRGLKSLARELDVPIIAMSQLSRAVEARQDHRPVLSDLRESGSIEQDADIVMFIHREELYKPDTDRKNIADLIIAKHRNGPTGSIPLRFFPAQTKFADLELHRPEL
ncbi:MAG TPA: replicative DNA helicase [Chloroflexota bacterium]|nr:replicative DNA helicase [Chloroflexota bacterium]